MDYGLWLIVLFPLAPLIFGPWLLRPIYRWQRERNSPRYFLLSDVACLLVLLSAAGTVAVQITPDSVKQELAWAYFVLMGGCWIFTGALWIGGVYSLNGFEVRRVLPRCAYLLVALPLAYVGSSILPVVAFFSLRELTLASPTAVRLAGVAGPFLGYIACRRAVLWVARQADSPLNPTINGEDPPKTTSK